jgi:two-component system cell cycle response regulator
MKLQSQPNDDLMRELETLRRRVSELKESEARCLEAEKALRDSETRFQSVAQSANDAIITSNRKGEIIFWNDAAQEMFGYPEAEVKHQPLTLLMPGHHEKAHQKGLERFGRTGKSKVIGETLELTGMRKDGSEFPLELSLSAWGSGGEMFYTGIVRDISKRKQAEEALEIANRELSRTVKDLEEANKKILDHQRSLIEEERLKVLLQMAGATSHELNQPLTVLLGNIELMRLHKDDPDKVQHHVAEIEEAGERISEIVRKIQGIRYYDTKPYLNKSPIINFDQKIRILVLEHSDDDFRALNRILKDQTQIQFSRAKSIEESFQVLAQRQFDIILLEYLLPDGNGVDFLQRLSSEGLDIPVVVVTGHGDEMTAATIIQMGAFDYLTKDRINDESISRTIANTLEKARFKRELRVAQEKLVEMSTKDELTGLYNHRYFREALAREVSRARRYKTDLVLCMFDLDRFKGVNDTFGHLAGDTVLSEVGAMLKKSVRESDLVCRYGGEELVAILPNTGPEKAYIVCERFRQTVARHDFLFDQSRIRVTVSAGIASYDGTADQSPTELLNLTDQALYQAKEMGRNRVVEYSQTVKQYRPKLGKLLVAEGRITEANLDEALSQQRLRIGEVLIQAGHLTDRQLNRALAYQASSCRRLGEILKTLGYASADEIDWALDRKNMKLGEVLMEKGLLTDGELDRALALQDQAADVPQVSGAQA